MRFLTMSVGDNCLCASGWVMLGVGELPGLRLLFSILTRTSLLLDIETAYSHLQFQARYFWVFCLGSCFHSHWHCSSSAWWVYSVLSHACWVSSPVIKCLQCC